MFIDYLQILKSIFLYVAGPTVFWLLLCLWFDRKQPEPAHQLFKTFLFGCLLATILVYIAGPISSLVKKIFINQPILKIFILSFLVDALIEEFAKIGLFNFKVYHLKSFDEPIDGIIYGLVLGLGFAFVENIFYGLAISSGKDLFSLFFFTEFITLLPDLILTGLFYL